VTLSNPEIEVIFHCEEYRLLSEEALRDFSLCAMVMARKHHMVLKSVKAFIPDDDDDRPPQWRVFHPKVEMEKVIK